jgi:hypothetical protein
MVPFLFSVGIAGMKLSDAVIISPQAKPAVQIDPSVARNISRINVYDFDTGSHTSSVVQSFLREKLYVLGLGAETSDGSPMAPFTVDLHDGLTAQRPLVEFHRNGERLGSLQCAGQDMHLVAGGDYYIGRANGNVFIPAQLNLERGVVNTSVKYVKPSSGEKLAIVAPWAEYLIDGSVTLSTLVATLPPSAVDGTLLKLRFNVGVTKLVVNTIDGSFVGHYPATVPAGSSIEWAFRKDLIKWFAG